jgi:hypothetical protein
MPIARAFSRASQMIAIGFVERTEISDVARESVTLTGAVHPQ